jgi:hypothetical protein
MHRVVAIHSLLTVLPALNDRGGDDVFWVEWLLVVTWNGGGLHFNLPSTSWNVRKVKRVT